MSYSKLAVLTDIHGNAPALRGVLADINRQGDLEHICCLGDMVSIGPDTDEVLDLLCSQPNLSMVMGNHDQYVLALATGQSVALHGEELDHQRWIADRLDRRFLSVLSSLPLTMTLKHSGKSVLLQHYHLNPSGGFASVDIQPTLEKLDVLYEASPMDVVCFGHHHVVHLFESDRRLYVNPGSLGCCDRPLARYGVLNLNGPRAQVELRAVPYDKGPFLASYEQLGVPARAFILAAFHGNQHMA